MLIAVKDGFAAGGKAVYPTDYVADGLLAMWDGIENAGWGSHSANMSAWKDLVSGREIALRGTAGSQVSVLEKSVQFVNPGNADMSTTLRNVKTIEVVCSQVDTRGVVTVDNRLILRLGDWRPELSCWYQSSAGSSERIRVGWGFNNRYWPQDCGSVGSTASTFSFVSKSSGDSLYKDAVRVKDMTHYDFQPVTYVELMNSYKNGSQLHVDKCSLHCIRLYSRVLDAAELAANRAVDDARFNLPDAT